MRVLVLLSACLAGTLGDVYLHTPRGSNNRNCRNDNNENRRNGNRLFDSQNNNKGGYSCPRSYPFDCYKYEDGSQAKATCQARNTQNANAGMLNNDINSPLFGELVDNSQDVVINERMSYYVGSVLPLEWTAQHGCGNNPKLYCDMILQVACEDTLTDVVGGVTRTVRDGTPVNNNDGNNLNDEATTTIPDQEGPEQADLRYGRHETLTYYQKCKNRERNQGLWIADQNVNNNQGATASRQNPNGNRNGLECPEESEYYPYWHDSPWKDLAILTSRPETCEATVAESQNVKAKNECVCNNGLTGDSQLPNNEAECKSKAQTNGCEWITVAPYNIPEPACLLGPHSRDNHLGNAGVGGADPIMMNWTIPEWLGGKNRCVLRLRYNMSAADEEDTPVVADSRLNDDGNGQTPKGTGTPIYDRNNNEEESYKAISGFDANEVANPLLGFAVNTNQYGRTFQDRTYTFSVKPASEVPSNCKDGVLYNLNVRGKRGNIVQAYPAVEYDFVPNEITITEDDCVHLQWTGSDYNPNRNPNNGEGGPPNPNNSNEGKSDRHNMVQMKKNALNFPQLEASSFNMFKASATQWKRMTYNDQPVNNVNECKTAGQIDENNREDRERHHQNCAKLSGQKIPHMDIGVVKAGAVGTYEYMSTRNNNLSNRGQKGKITVEPGKGMSAGQIAAVVVGSLVAVMGAAFVGKYLMERKGSMGGAKSWLPTSAAFSSAGGASSSYTPHYETKRLGGDPVPRPAGGGGSSNVVAKHPYTAQEGGELSFKKGDIITVLRKDASGWWEGRVGGPNGTVGVFPSNYVS